MSNTNIIQPKSSTVLHIRSKDATQVLDGFNTDFNLNLKNPIIVANDEELHISLMSCEIPYSFYNISSDLNNNTLYYAETLLTFTNQDYSIDDVIDFFNNDTGFSAKFTTTYDRQKNKIKFTNISDSTQILQFANSTINKVIGYDDTGRQDDVTVASGAFSESPFVCNLATVHSLLIKANIGQANVLSTISGNSSILQKVSVDVNTNGIIYLNQQDFRQISISQAPIIDHIEFKITDQNNNLLQLNNVNFELSVIFQIFPKYNSRNTQRDIIAPQNSINVPTQPTSITRPEDIVDDVDSTHPITGKTEIEHRADRIILDEIIDQID